MINQELLEEATNKFRTSNDEIKLAGNIIDLLMKCYIKYDPSKRGNMLQKLIIQYLGRDVYKAPSTWNCGDFALGSQSFLWDKSFKNILTTLDGIIDGTKIKDRRLMLKMRKDFIRRFFEVVSTFYEIKTSYLSDDGTYTIGNIRTYQNYQYLVLFLFLD